MGKFDNVLIVSDIDRTFLAQDRSVPKKNLEALKYFQNEGGKFTFATGRSHLSLLHTFPDAAELLNFPAILGNGSYLFDYRTEQVLCPMFLDKKLAVQVARLSLDSLPETGIRILTPEVSLYSSINKYIESEISQGWYRNISKYQKPEDWTGENWCKIVIRDDPDQLNWLRILLMVVFENKDIEMVKSEEDFLEIQAKGCNKGRGIDILRESNKALKIYACGDYENDISMMKRADIAVCPSNASEDVKSIADMCLCSCNDGVIADLINQL